jgi:hypothetical protein
MKTPDTTSALCGTETPLATPEAREEALDAVREANGRRAIRPADTVAGAADDIAAFLVVPAWAEGETAAKVAADTLCTVHGLDAAVHPYAWMLYTEGARRLGFPGPVPVPTTETGGPAQA